MPTHPREHEEETGDYYYRARYYNPGTGRFLSEDPIGFAGGDTNLYRYVQNNPISFVDPQGMANTHPNDTGPMLYKNQHEAAFSALDSVNNLSMSINREIGGIVVQNTHGEYYTTNYVIGSEGSVYLNLWTNDRLVGDFHTHGGPAGATGYDNFSKADIDSNREISQKLGRDYSSYMISPSNVRNVISNGGGLCPRM